MKAVLIGSAAYKKNTQDIDLVANQEFVDALLGKHELQDSKVGKLASWFLFHIDKKIVEVNVPFEGTTFHKILVEADGPRFDDIRLPCQPNIISVEVLAAIKKAHLILPHKWETHIKEYKALKDKLDVKFFKSSEHGVGDIYKLHRKECKQKAKLHPKLNVKKDDFFEDAEFKIFDHDTIHKAVALGDRPAYTLMQDGEVWCSRKKWKLLTEEEKLSCLIEEATVLALERSIIPALFLPDRGFRGEEWAYKYALQKICTTITSGWFRDYSIEHYHEAVENKPEIKNMFFDGLRAGTVKIIRKDIFSNEAAACS